jgi:hypothetical protein
MTGPCAGKLLLDAKVLLGQRRISAQVYIHKKGFGGAAVTHLDIESPELNLIAGKGGFLAIDGTGNGILIHAGDFFVEVVCDAVSKVLEKGRSTYTWVGQKQDGIYVGFRREEMLKLDALADEMRPIRDV